MTSPKKRRIVDAHFHFYDHQANRHDFLEHVDPTFEAFVGDYSTLPRRYLMDDYNKESAGVEVAGLVWHEFLSSDPLREAQWAQRMATTLATPMSTVVKVDFLADDLETLLHAYAACPNVTAVREHLAWDNHNPLRRFANRPDLLTDPQWRQGLNKLKSHNFKCSLEVFAHQLPDLLTIVRLNPDIGFGIAVMGWPLDLSESGFALWKQNLAALSKCENTRITISAIECVFGMNWTTPQVLPWIHTVFELFGPERIMFGSHRPISGLAASFETLYAAYEAAAAGLSPSEQDAVFHRNAQEWFKVPILDSKPNSKEL
jgi:predicted TIM-barrel fold metal-dependent hydrolase